MHWSLDGIYRSGERDGVWHRPGGGIVDHNDGDSVEERLLSVVRNASDLSSSSAELAEQIVDWPSNYHLSPRRANLLRPLSDLLRGDTLDVGAGCGALTRYLGETGRRVLAIEGSPRRAAIAAQRCRDLPGVSVVCDRVEEARLTAHFDAIALIGVLEYASLYIGGADPAVALLRRFREQLKPGGCVLVGIENQLGLKYLGGAPEDHRMIPMFGIDDLYGDGSVTTFGWKQLGGIFREAGFADMHALLPFPDYKLPTTVILPRAYEADFDIGPLLAATACEDPQPTRIPTFSLERAWRVAARNGLARELSNSFLVVARVERVDHPLGLSNEGVLLHRFGLPRRNDAEATTFRLGPGGDAEVSRQSALPVAGARYVRPSLSAARYVSGAVWADELLLSLNRYGWMAEDVLEWTRPWHAFLLASSHHGMLPGESFDDTPLRLIRTASNEFRRIAPGWIAADSASLDHVVFRGLWRSLVRATSVAPPGTGTSLSRLELVRQTMRGLGCVAAAEAMVEREAAFLAETGAGVESRLSLEEAGQSLLVARTALSK